MELDAAERTDSLEQRILASLLVCHLLHRERAARESRGSSSTDAAGAGDAMQARLVARLQAGGAAECIYESVQHLYAILDNEAARVDAKPPSAGGDSSDILQVHGPGVGARTVAPFFTEAYGKAHTDLFEDSQVLLLHALLHLAQALAEHKVLTEQPSVPTKWLELLSSIIHHDSMAASSKLAKKLLLTLCGSKQHYSEQLDRGLADLELKRLAEWLQLAAEPDGGGVEAPVRTDALLSYEVHVRLSTSLQSLHEAAISRPRNWSRYCTESSSDSKGALGLILRALLYLQQDEGLVSILMRLLSAGLQPDPIGGSADDERLQLDHLQLEQLLKHPGITPFIVYFPLEPSTSKVRLEACVVLRHMWSLASGAQRRRLKALLCL